MITVFGYWIIHTLTEQINNDINKKLSNRLIRWLRIFRNDKSLINHLQKMDKNATSFAFFEGNDPCLWTNNDNQLNDYIINLVTFTPTS